MCAYAAAMLLVLLGLRMIRRSSPELRGLAHLRRFILCGLIAMLLFALRSRVPPFFTVVAPNLMLFAGAVYVYCASAEILELRARLVPWMAGLCGAGLLSFLWFTFGQSSVTGRLESHCVVVGTILGATASLLFRRARTALLDPARACGWLLSASVMLNLMWAIFGLIYHPSANFMHPDAMDAGFSYLLMILALANAVGLAWLSLCVHRQELQTMAQTDSLTGLLNRGAFEEILRRELLRAESTGRGMGLMLIDIDYFKQVNDAHGHLAGDDVLRRIGAALRMGTRPSDVLARFGGEEFVILLRDASAEATEEVAERLRADIAALDDLPGRVSLTGSFGVAVSVAGETAAEFLVRADQALYRSKREGRNLVRVDRSARRETGLHAVVSRT